MPPTDPRIFLYSRPVRALLLLAGRSRRFWPLAEKSLFPICGKTLAQHQVETLREGGCKDITLVAGAHNKKELRKLFPGFAIVEQKNLALGMQGACMSALPKIKHGPVLIVSGNDVIEPSAFEMLRKEAAKPKVDGAILARKVKKYFPGGYLTVKAGRIVSIIEKPSIDRVGATHTPPKLVNIVAHIHNDPAALLTALKKVRNGRDDGYEQALHALFVERTYRAVPYEGFWQPVKYPWHLLPLLEYFLSGIAKPAIHRSAKIHPTAIVEGNVIIGEDTRILPHAVIRGPCVIGRSCVIGNNALVRGSSIGDGCVIGYNTEVKGSVLAGSVWTHMTYLGDSVIGRNVSFGGGFTTGNLRLDEEEISSGIGSPVEARRDMPQQPTGLAKLGLIAGDDCRFGIQVATNPGVKVGAGSFVATCAVLDSDIPEKSFATMKGGVATVRPNRVAAPSMESRMNYRAALT